MLIENIEWKPILLTKIAWQVLHTEELVVGRLFCPREQQLRHTSTL